LAPDQATVVLKLAALNAQVLLLLIPAKGTGNIVIKESDGTIFETLGIQHANITIGGTDNKTLTINPSANLESGKSYYIEMASSVLTDVAGNNFAGINNSSTEALLRFVILPVMVAVDNSLVLI
jgi:hypothetical protein